MSSQQRGEFCHCKPEVFFLDFGVKRGIDEARDRGQVENFLCSREVFPLVGRYCPLKLMVQLVDNPPTRVEDCLPRRLFACCLAFLYRLFQPLTDPLPDWCQYLSFFSTSQESDTYYDQLMEWAERHPVANLTQRT